MGVGRPVLPDEVPSDNTSHARKNKAKTEHEQDANPRLVPQVQVPMLVVRAEGRACYAVNDRLNIEEGQDETCEVVVGLLCRGAPALARLGGDLDQAAPREVRQVEEAEAQGHTKPRWQKAQGCRPTQHKERLQVAAGADGRKRSDVREQGAPSTGLRCQVLCPSHLAGMLAEATDEVPHHHLQARVPAERLQQLCNGADADR
mmetsp:Transcript_63852/g.197693  ORF Transcript_63852/g.197693 Transcript_63852/m.197693 type:complete len:203 (-) Transcript_63852:114-722(-)